MKYIFLAFSLIVFSITTEAQSKEEREKAKMEQKVKEYKAEYIANIVNSFEIDDFQKHILTQQLDIYYDKLRTINLLQIPSFEKTTLVNELNNSHFKDFEEMLGKEFVAELIEKTKGEDKSIKKKKKKKKKRKKDN